MPTQDGGVPGAGTRGTGREKGAVFPRFLEDVTADLSNVEVRGTHLHTVQSSI